MSCTSLLCVVSVSVVNVTLDTTQSRGAERECRVMGRPTERSVSMRRSGVETGYAVDGNSDYVALVSVCLVDG